MSSVAYWAKVKLITSFPNQTITAYSSISDLDADIAPIFTTTTDSNFESEYTYATNTNITLYFKSELWPGIDQWWISAYTLQSGEENVLYLWVWGSFWSVITAIEEIKWSGFITDTHSLSSQTGSLSVSDKNDIADKARDQIELSSWMLQDVLDFVSEVLTRIFSIKSDTQKI